MEELKDIHKFPNQNMALQHSASPASSKGGTLLKRATKNFLQTQQ
jgi:hypothetical protein